MMPLSRNTPNLITFGWLAALITASAAYIFMREISPQNWDWLIKIIPIALLIQLAVTHSSGKTRSFLVSGLILSGIGDVLLSLDGLFIIGLGAFLLAQLTYTVLFLTQCKWNAKRLPWATLVVLYTVVCTVFIIPKTGELQLVITAYMIAITFMALAAGFRDDSRFLIVACGALIFMLSDTLIAINKFVTPFDYSGAAIMATYYIAQASITLGICRHYRETQKV
ncbi:lysoplasmalogenase [Bermanella sp. R86510]|uniref:lysoplasmalogenase n=1 Tax=unclassified Bermanella TaxID=2627862 RepID=UPI0037CAAF6D